MPKLRNKHGPEYYLQGKIVKRLIEVGWHVERVIGNALQKGLPDLMAMHPRYGIRLIDVKNPGSYSFTRAQKVKWPVFHSYGGGVYILTSPDEVDLLLGSPNWLDYWKTSWGDPFESLEDRVDQLLDELEYE